MKRHTTLMALAALSVLAACGADGEPVQPTMNSTITLSDSGVGANTSIAVNRGPVTIGLGLGL
jgi:ABC-type glycerol-3-phosphate transport system substrate-binding protein